MTATTPPVQIVKVPERQITPQSAHEIATASVAAQAKALVEARYVMALQRPRDINVARIRLLESCKRPRFAEMARYIKPIGKGIEGPSIRLAEEAARCLGNIAVDIMTVFDDERRRVVRVSATDLETNLPYSKDVTIEKTVERNQAKEGYQVVGQRIGSRGQTVYVVLATDDEILNKENALTSKALRANLLRLVPADLLEEAMDRVYATLRDKTAQDPSAERKRLMDGFALQGIMPDKLEEYLGHDLEMTTPAELIELRGVFTSLRDGEATWPEVMEHRRKVSEADGKEKPPASAAAPSATPPSTKTTLTDVAAQAKAKREASAKPARGIAVKLADGSPADLGDEDAAARAATAPTEREIADRGPPPASSDDMPEWAK